MELSTLMSFYFRLRQDLSSAYKMQPWQSGRIDRIANELAVVEREIAARRASADEAETTAGAQRVAVARSTQHGAAAGAP